ncbi:MAG: tetratricopeptide repeat protein [Alphaproteobacteria bacterium]|nr:tetratricopeptide repeat protein [Alphaproteobacteria bacterium]
MNRVLRLVLVSLAAFAAPAMVQAADKAWVSCLRQPERADDLEAVCTVVIDSAEATAVQRAAALNNRGADRAFRGASREQARRDLDQAIALQPDIAKLFNTRGYIRMGDGDAAGAVDDYSQAIRLDPHFAVAYGNRAEALMSLGRADEAMRDVNEAIRLAPSYAHPLYDPYQTRAAIKEAKGDLKGAEADRTLGSRMQGKAGKPGALNANVSGDRIWDPWLIR